VFTGGKGGGTAKEETFPVCGKYLQL